MSRTLSYQAHSEAFLPQTGEVFLVLLTIQYGASYIRIVNNTENVTSGGNLFTAYPFEITLPEDIEDRLPEARVTIDNVDRMIVTALRDVTTRPDAMIQVVCADTPNVIEEEYDYLKMSGFKFTAQTVTASLVYEDILSESFPTHLMDPSNFPGIFGLPSGSWG